MLSRFLAVLSLSTLLLIPLASAQTTVSGTVTGPSDATMPNAQTNDAAIYVFGALQPGMLAVNPDSNINSATFGRIASASTAPRLIVLNARFSL